jgi:3-oxoacyl-[acyl-carrier protein] reductase
VAGDMAAGDVALVTGGGRGIGAGIARELAAAGLRVAIADVSAEQSDDVARELGAVAVQADVSDAASVSSMVARVERELGAIDLLVNNAGITNPADTPPLWDEDPAHWWRVFEVNVRGAYLCCRAVLPGMVERRRGRIVNLGSELSYAPLPGEQRWSYVAYGPSKAALCRFGELLAGQVKERGIAVFTISPGLVRTAMSEAQSLGEGAPWTPLELAPRLVRVLASGRADGLTGRYIHAANDDIEDLIRRADELRELDLNTIRLRRR